MCQAHTRPPKPNQREEMPTERWVGKPTVRVPGELCVQTSHFSQEVILEASEKNDFDVRNPGRYSQPRDAGSQVEPLRPRRAGIDNEAAGTVADDDRPMRVAEDENVTCIAGKHPFRRGPQQLVTVAHVEGQA